ncbi:hypothetical protein H072_7827 [Dactylellina haptotyla CBS 200.50]|uniref:PNPLA domain-containing protein n=1 Tax=Dactylellina haptotyla (strain CBS 200.50) TaxID=1284197 RepID=S8BGM6_DACHA|nr:hypothetical protein H072_7827 [Dactylellina haptotyla CBS 200.50]
MESVSESSAEASAAPRRKPLRLLSLDGGGIRGLSELVILKEILQRVKHDCKLADIPRPCEYFDLIGGTSTGGIIALMLGRMGMTVDEAITKYETLSEEVFAETKRWTQDGRFKATKLEAAVKKVVKEFTGTEDTLIQASVTDILGCNAFVCAQPAVNIGNPRLFRTYETREEASPNIPIWQAARATSAAPTFFKRAFIGSGSLKEEFIDAGLGCNNPTKQLLDEAERFYEADYPISCIVSIDCESTAEEIEKRFKNNKDTYFRFSVDQGLQDIKLGEWDKLSTVLTHTLEYTRKFATGERIDRAVKTLIERQVAIPTEELRTKIVDSSLSRKARCRTGPTKPKSTPNITAAPPTGIFTGRENDLDKINQYFEILSEPREVKQRVVVVWGPGGAGKTQLALKFIDLHSSKFRMVLSVDATNKEKLETSFLKIASQVSRNISSMDQALNLLAQSSDWLLFFDNADDTSLDLRPYFPICKHGDIFITTRNLKCKNYAVSTHLNISELQNKDAIDLLLKVAGEDEDDGDARNQADEICNTLGHLALAIVQAGSYIQSGACSISGYLDIFTNHRNELMRRRDLQSIDDYKESVYTTWDLSFGKLNSHAKLLLKLCAGFHYKAISQRLFTGIGEVEHRRQQLGTKILEYFLSERPKDEENKEIYHTFDETRKEMIKLWTSDGEFNLLKFNDSVLEIASFSLISIYPKQQQYSIHRLIHGYIRDKLSDSEKISYYGSALEILGASMKARLSFSEQIYQKDQLANIEFLLQNSLIKEINFNNINEALLYNSKKGEAEELQTNMLRIQRSVLSEDDPILIYSMRQLAIIYHERNMPQKAEEILKSLLTIVEKKYGYNHVYTLRVKDLLACGYFIQGRLNEAEEILVKAETKQMVLSTDSSSDWSSVSILAAIYTAQGRLKEAEDLYKEVIEHERKNLGAEHPRTLGDTEGLAIIYYKCGRWQEAEGLFEKILRTLLRELGIEHLMTIRTVGNLARCYRKRKDWKKTEELSNMLTRILPEICANKYPNMVKAMIGLVAEYRKQERWVEAEKLENKYLRQFEER